MHLNRKLKGKKFCIHNVVELLELLPFIIIPYFLLTLNTMSLMDHTKTMFARAKKRYGIQKK